MAKKKSKQAKENVETAPTQESDEVLTVVKTKATKEDKAKLKEAKKQTKLAKGKAKKNKPRGGGIKGVFSELKKVSWPSFKKTCKQTGTVLVVVGVFMIVILGIDVFLSWLMSLVVG